MFRLCPYPMIETNRDPETLPEVAPTELSKLADQIGNFMHHWGFKKIHGRIWTYIYLSETPLDAGSLMRVLNVSKALMSLSLHDLLKHNVIKEAGKSPRGTQVFLANPDLVQVILEVLKTREMTMLNDVENTFQKFKTQGPAEGLQTERIDKLGALIHEAKRSLEGVLQLSAVDFQSWENSLN